MAEIAANASFADPSHFSHPFERLVGITPGQFRSLARFEPRPTTRSCRKREMEMDFVDRLTARGMRLSSTREYMS